VSGTLIVVVGVSLLSAGAHLVTGNDPTAPTYAQPSRIGLAAIVVLLIVVVLKLGKGFAGQLAVLLALVAGTIIAVPFHLVSFAGLGEAAAFGVPRPFRFGAPVFELGAAVAITVGFLVTLIENLANLQLISRVVDRPLGEKDVARAFRADSLATALGGVFSSYPYASFSQNIGIVSLTGVRSRFVVAAAGVVFICLGIIPSSG
jgi:NCS2 family nucleobase:cation symporter-2